MKGEEVSRHYTHYSHTYDIMDVGIKNQRRRVKWPMNTTEFEYC